MKLIEAIKLLQDAGIDDPAYDAKEIFKTVGALSPIDLISKNASASSDAVVKAIERRINREPLQYIIGEVGFYREVYEVSRDCLIPRQDTEILVDYAVKNIPSGETFIDLCTGSGCIAVSTLKNTLNTSCLAVDISSPALSVAKRNAIKNGVSERVEFSLQDALAYKPCGKVFAVLSNPPYVTESEYESLDKELYYEPKIALVGNDNGLEFYKKITRNVKDFLKPGGFIAFEIGKDQGDALAEIAEENQMQATILKDFSSHPRVAILKNTK